MKTRLSILPSPRQSRRVWLTQSAALPCWAFGVATGCAEKQFSCDDVSGLEPREIAVRQNLAYVDKAPNPEQACDKCQQYVPAAAGQCGICKVMPGPTHPNATCKVFVPQG